MTMTLMRPTFIDYRDEVFEEELLVEMRLAELVIALSGCSARQAFRLVRRRGKEKPLDRIARALAVTRQEIGANS